MTQVLLVIATIILAVVAFQLVMTLRELQQTLRTYRNLEERLVPLLDNSRRVTANIEDITRQVLLQAAKVENMTEKANEMVESVRDTVDKYNRAIARPALIVANLASGLKSVAGVFRKRQEEE